jgi:hypothetical protein
MKKVSLIVFFLFALGVAYAQNENKLQRPDYDQMNLLQAGRSLRDDGFITKYGFIIKKGDTLTLGKGSQPDRKFAFAYESQSSLGSSGSEHDKKYLESQFSNRKFKIKDLLPIGSKKKGYIIYAKFGIGGLVNYWIEIDNAIDAGELILPEPYNAEVKKANGVQPTVVVEQTKLSVADELKKMKDLLDQGIITKDEFEAQKKKLLGQQ